MLNIAKPYLGCDSERNYEPKTFSIVVPGARKDIVSLARWCDNLPMQKSQLLAWSMFASLLLAGCGSGGSAKADAGCVTGYLRCACFGNNTCNAGLVCLSQICVNQADIPGAGGATGSGGAGGSSSSSACETGNLRCSCYGNLTCNNNLVCVSDICVDLPGTGGVIGSGGVIAPGGTTAASGGVIAPGGITASSGGVIAPGGITASSGGVIAPGGIIAGSGGAVATGALSPAAAACWPRGASSPATRAHRPRFARRDPLLSGHRRRKRAEAGNSYGIDGAFYAVGDGCSTITWNAATRCASGVLCAKDPPD